MPSTSQSVVSFFTSLWKSHIAPREADLAATPEASIVPLTPVIEDLDRLNHSTEGDFLKVGGDIAAFIKTVDLIASELAELTSLIAGEDAQRTCQALTGALDRSLEMKIRAEEDHRLLSSLRQEASQLKHTLTGLEGTASTFRTLGVLTRVETARISEAGDDFGQLAGDVRAGSGSIHAKVVSALDDLIPSIENVLRNVSHIEEGQSQDLPRLLAEASASLAAFRDNQQKTVDATARLCVRYGAISAAFKKLIVSLQFHDITRQQVEHVIDALRRLVADENPPDTAIILALQGTQLANASDKFAALAASVSSNLNGISTHVLEIIEETHALSSLSSDETNSVFVQMEQGCTAILATLDHCMAAQAAIQTVAGGLLATVARMRKPVEEEIQGMESQMRRLAMNARISAFHLGPTGEALGVIAAPVQDLASECKQRSDLLVDALGAMRQVATLLSHEGSPQALQESESALRSEGEDDCLAGMRTAVADLHASSERGFAQIARIVERCGHLRADLFESRNNFSVEALFSDGIGRSQRALKDIGSTMVPGAAPDDAAVAHGLAEYAKHYTMKEERDVHASLANLAAPIAEEIKLPDSGPNEVGEFGDGVELF